MFIGKDLSVRAIEPINKTGIINISPLLIDFIIGFWLSFSEKRKELKCFIKISPHCKLKNYNYKIISYLPIWCNKFTFRLPYAIIKLKGEDKNDSQKFYKNRLWKIFRVQR